MTELTKYQLLKMYLPVNGYSSMSELARDWEVSTQAIRQVSLDKTKSENLENKINDFIAKGDKRFQEHRSKSNLAKAEG